MVDRLQGLQHLQFFVAPGVGLERVRRLQRNETNELHHMVLDHVADRARFLIVTAASLDAQRLGDGDLHMIDVSAVPDGLEGDVGEAQRRGVLHRFLAEIVIDAENISLEEDGADHIVDGRGALAVSADRLLNDDARARVTSPSRPRRFASGPNRSGPVAR